MAARGDGASGSLPVNPACRLLGITLEELSPGRAVMRMTVRDDMVNQYDMPHGGILFTLADAAFSYACNATAPVSVALDASISFAAACTPGDTLTAVCEARTQSRRTGVYDATLTNASGDVIAFFRGTSYRVREEAAPAPEVDEE
jgi:acyl-CoA thioesterase